MKGQDITGQRFGRLTVLRRTTDKYKKSRYFLWECLCDCGSICAVTADRLRSGNVRSCGCYQRESRMHDITDQRFGRLIALEYTGKTKDRSTVWRFRCDCGNEIEARYQEVVHSHKRSCGCIDHENKMQQAVATQDHLIRENRMNFRSDQTDVMNRHNTSGYRGVSWCIRYQKYQSKIVFKGKFHHLGYFSDPAEASKAYQAAKERMHGEWHETQTARQG